MRDSIIENIHSACPVLPINTQYFSKLDGKSAIEDAAAQLVSAQSI
jgi:PTS system cellobiose-specific IIC component